MKTLKKRLNEGIARVYLVEGDDFYLYDKAFSMIKNACKISLEDFNVNVFDDENFSLLQFFNATEMMPMVDEKRLVVVKNIKLNEADKKSFYEMLMHIPKTTVVLILDYNNNLEYLKKDFVFVDAGRMDEETVKKLVVAYLAKQDRRISQDALSSLIMSCNGYLTRVFNELSKLVCCDLQSQLITKNMVDILRMTFVAASSNSPKCSMATKKANHEATPIKGLNMLQIETRQTWYNTPLSKFQFKP